MTNKFYNHLYETYPRIYVTQDLNADAQITLSPAQAHYFKNVIRKSENDPIRVFNGRDGEWLATLSALSKKSATAATTEKLRDQPISANKTTLYFAPIKKARLDLLIEKSVELGVDALHPVITARTENRKPKMERIQTHIIEAAEQCERLTIPQIAAPIPLTSLPRDRTIYACIERNAQREAAPFITAITDPNPAFLIGPEGGFTGDEIASLSTRDNTRFISLGDRIYRAETAAMLCLAHATLSHGD